MIGARPVFTLYVLMMWLGAAVLEMQLKSVMVFYILELVQVLIVP
jgi:hypothetical protein